MRQIPSARQRPGISPLTASARMLVSRRNE